ncbi:sigma-E factor negative regulatory protein [Coralloluteibacterium thermophilus]|uniref:Sigma-E factor negative regulatory protein n=1 Tax=Coralloluteibacterium thermophilum TaxID=2707049 RepID=A0ABV9NMW5_9GAMM
MPSVEEQLSALRDGELGPDQTRFLLRRVSADAALAARWERWQIAADALKRVPQRRADDDFVARVLAGTRVPDPAVAEAADVVAESAPRRRLWGAGAAVAASVAVVAMLVARPVDEAAQPAVADESPVVVPLYAGPSPNPFNRLSQPVPPQDPDASVLLPVAVGDAPARPWPSAGLVSDPMHASLMLQPVPEAPPPAEAEAADR